MTPRRVGCPACFNLAVRVRQDGTLYVHLRVNVAGRRLTTKCPGSGEPPEPVCPRCGLAGCLVEW